MSALFRVTFVVTRGNNQVNWDEVFLAGIITAQNGAMAQAEATHCLPNAIELHRTSGEDPVIDEDDIPSCKARVEPLQAWIDRNLQAFEDVKTYNAEPEEAP